MKFDYTGYDIQGRSVAGEVEAGAKPEAAEQLRRQGVFVTEINERSEHAIAAKPGAIRGKRSGSTGTKHLVEVAHFCRQLSILVGTKTPLVQALGALERQTAEGPWRSTIGDVRRRVEEGTPLSEALESHQAWFDPVARAMISAGEAGASLEGMLKNLADLTRQQLQIRKAIVGALIYPCVLVGVSILVLAGMILFMLPRFKELFTSLGAKIPGTTQMLMNLSDVLREQWWLGPAIVAIAIGIGVWASRSLAIRIWIEGVMLKAPKLGPIIRSFATARLARVLGVLLQAKVPMLDAIRLTRQATKQAAYADLLQRAEDSVSRGENLSRVMSDPKLISPSVSEAVASGERNGQIGAVLVQVAEFMDEDNATLVKSLTSLIEPLILTVLGIVIGLVAISMFLPLFDLTAGAAGG